MQALNQVTSPLWLIPAYGRTYRSKEAVVKDWQAGKDFLIDGGPYCSIRDLSAMREQFQNIYIDYGTGTMQV
jgi:hypothetical protein